jgi:hypothetical protein
MGLKIFNTLKFDSGIATSNSILNTNASTILSSDGALRSYLYSSDLKSVTIFSSVNSNTLDPSNIVNVSFTRTSNATGIIQDILPSADTIVTLLPGYIIGTSFEFVYKYVGVETSILLYGNIVSQGNFLIYNNPIQAVTVPNKAIYRFIGRVESLSPVVIVYYVINQQSIEPNNQQISKLGLLTNNFDSYLSTTNDTYIIYPFVQSVINSTSGVTYTIDNIKGSLITRGSLTADSTDALPVSISSSFPIGSGLINFTVQNISNFNLVVGTGAESGWSYGGGSRTIASSSVGTFDIYVDTSANAYTLYSTGLSSMNG